MEGLLAWLSALPPAALYATMAFAAGIENVLPPLPADTVVAFGGFLAARGGGSLAGAFAATWLGNLAGASLMYWVGRRYGADAVRRRLPGAKSDAAGSRLTALHERYGLFALFLSRFLPGVRALVPPFAGALGLPFLPSLAVMGTASGLWYGLVSILAFRVGTDWPSLQHRMAALGVSTAAIAAALAIIATGVWVARRRTRGAR